MSKPEEVIARFKKCRKGEVVISSITWARIIVWIEYP